MFIVPFSAYKKFSGISKSSIHCQCPLYLAGVSKVNLGRKPLLPLGLVLTNDRYDFLKLLSPAQTLGSRPVWPLTFKPPQQQS